MKALKYAVGFAKQFGARLCLLYVGQGYYFVPELGPLDTNALETRARADAAGKLAALATEEVRSDVPVDVSVRQGSPPAEIINAANEFNADLIIISTHGYTGLKHVWFGSVTENLVRHARCPVLVVREEEHEFLG
jgi:nucleotide-binding universal stress UspA family protein